tara:strand:+ start:63 stop:317 length:255 start_codon:yes stop_codon:yes gene_type:complete
MNKTELTKIIKDYGKFRIEAETLEDLESYETNLINVLNEAINYTHSCERDSEQLHTEVFNLANKLAINGYGNEAVKMHGICNGM